MSHPKTMTTTPAHNFRKRILLQIFRGLVIPPILTYIFASSFTLSWTLSFLLCVLSVPVTISARTYWATYVQMTEAQRLGARLVTRVRGRYPGNIDIVLAMLKHHSESYIFESFRQTFQQYGETTLNLRILWEDKIITVDEGHTKFILSTGFDDFAKGHLVQEIQETFLGNGIFNRDGDEWKVHRALTRPFFALERISDFDTFDKYADDTLDVLARASSQPYQGVFVPDESSKGWEHSATPVDVQDLFARFTLDSASSFLFGACTDTLRAPLPIAGRSTMGPKGSKTEDAFGDFAAAFEDIQAKISLRFRRGGLIWPLREIFKDETNQPVAAIRAWIDPMVERAIAEKKLRRQNESASKEEATTLLSHLAESSDDSNYIRFELLNILLAARDTTAATLTFITYMLAMHPDVKTRLRAEVLDMCGNDGTPTYEILRGMKYMRAVINEALRLFPPVPADTRQTIRNTVLPPSKPDSLHSFSNTSTSQGLYVPSGTLLTYVTIELQRRPDLWGADADTFDPDRWLDSRLERFTKNPAMFVPFNAGPRICLGQNFAYNEVSFFLIKLLQRYDDFALAPDAQPAASLPRAEWRGPGRTGRQTFERLWLASAMTLFAKGGVWMRFRQASDA